MIAGFLTFMLLMVVWYRSRGPTQRAIVNRGLRWGLVLGCFGFGIGLLASVALTAAIEPTESWGLVGLAPFVLGPLFFKIGFVVGFPAGMIREWFRQAADWQTRN